MDRDESMLESRCYQQQLITVLTCFNVEADDFIVASWYISETSPDPLTIQEGSRGLMLQRLVASVTGVCLCNWGDGSCSGGILSQG